MEHINQLQPQRESVWNQSEISLCPGLSEAVQTNRRADFSYLLALLSTNVTESDFARLQRDKTPANEWTPPFAVGPGRPLSATASDWERNPARHFAQSFTAWRLLNALEPEALVDKNDVSALPAEVRDNCPPYVRARWSEAAVAQLSGQEADLFDIIQRERSREGVA